MRPNTVKRKLQAGQVSVGTWLMSGSTLVAEALAHQGFDWL
ncbi:MAG: 2-dehydro-3-deoxyglucarate aldolase, partial [Chloroflexi bacterium]|nr:2-dehydro-3-deoxyglucarate aldolase [Chloroflexota bacterium]